LTYRLARVIKWDVVEEPPPAGGDGRTMIPGPREEDVDSLNAMAKAANWKDLAEEAESQFLAGGAFFLDLQRHAAQALEAQGAHQAAQAVADECARLLGRLPGIERMSFADGRAFADPATRQWLETIQPRGGQAGQASPRASDDDDWRREALDLAGAGDLQGGLRRMQEAVRSAPGRKQALERRLAAAELCLDYGKPTWGVPILEDLDRQLHETKLADWAPEIFARVWAGLIKGYRAGDDGTGLDNQTRAKLEDAKRRLFETDMALAARLSQSDD
jgi:type VI secretion system protein VasJ